MITEAAKPAEHTVNLKLIETTKNGKKKKFVIAVPKNLDVRRGDTVQFRSDDGQFKVVFRKSWPLKLPQVTDSRTRTFKKEGEFDYYCYIYTESPRHRNPQTGNLEAAKRTEYGYKDGGTGNVKPPGK